MKSSESFHLYLDGYFSNDKRVRDDLFKSMMVRYVLLGLASLFLSAFHTALPFPYPHFFLLCLCLLCLNTVLHLLSYRKGWLPRVFISYHYFDTIAAPFIFLYTGGFLTPFVMTHMVSAIGTTMYNQRIRLRALVSFGVLMGSYLSVALLQKYGIVPVYLSLGRELMDNDLFFGFVVACNCFIIFAGYILVNIINLHTSDLLTEMKNSFDSILKGTIAESGKNAFDSLARNLSDTFGPRCVMVAEIDGKAGELRSRSIWENGSQSGSFVCRIDNSIFAEVLSKREYGCDRNARTGFPDDEILARTNADFFFGTALIDSKDNPIGVLCIISDKPLMRLFLVKPLITIFASRAAAELERTRNEEKQKIVETQLAQAHKLSAIGQLASGIAHDFNNMIGAVNGYARILQKNTAKDSPNQRYINQIIDAGAHASELIGQLTRFSRREITSVRPVDINKTVAEVAELLRGTIPAKIVIECRCIAEPLYSPGDATQLASALLNLGINARDAMDPARGGTITFSTSTAVLEKNGVLCQSFRIEPGEYAAITVADTGTGMSADTMAHLFEPFFTTKPKGKGTGLGLANVWAYVEGFKGAVEIKSRLGEGSSFVLYVPVGSPGSGDGQNTPPAPTAADAALPATILVVDDDTAIRELVVQILVDNGYSVLSAEDGIRALEVLRGAAVNIGAAIVDIVMPNLGGRETLAELRRIKPELGAILISGAFDEKTLGGLIDKKTTFFLAKPFPEELLLATLGLVLQRSG